MSTALKWLFSSILVIAFILVIAYASAIQNINTHTTSEVKVIDSTLSVGIIRSELDDEGKQDDLKRKFVTNQSS